MAKRYRPVNRDQAFLLPPDMRDWLPADHPVHLVIRVIEDHLDTGAFHARRRTGGAGTAGYDPDMLLTVLVWAYANRVTGSRRIEQLCRTDVAFRLVCAGNLPDHCTIARFRAGFGGAIAAFFAEVLGLCAALGMGRLGVVALDGTKIAASAGAAANRTEDTLRKIAEEAVAAHAAADAEEDDLFGPGRRGDEVPDDAWSPRSRDERIAAALAGLRALREAAGQAEAARAEAARARQQAAVARAEQNLAAARQARAAQLAGLDRRWAEAMAAAGTPPWRTPTAGVDDYCRVRDAAARAAAARQRQAAAAQNGKKNGKKPGSPAVRNVTDPDSRLMPVRGGGFIQGYNAQNVTSEDGLIIATELTQDTTDTGWFEPMLRAAEEAAALIEASRPASHDGQPGIGLLLADAGYCSEHNLTVRGPDRLIATGKRRDLEHAARGSGTSREPAGPATRAMARRLKTEDGLAAYRHRGRIAETPHGNIKHNMRFRQLSLRGKRKASAEWKLAAAVHNLLTAISSGHLTAAALDQLRTTT
jgi:transposase